MTRRAAVCAAGLALGVLLGGALGAAGQRASGKAGPSVSFLGELPPLFVENRGQTHPAVAFLVQGLGRTLFFTDAGVVVALREGQRQQVLRLVFVGARRVRPVGADRQAAVFSWFKGAQPSGWRRSVASWGRVAYRDLWPGIDLVWTAEGERLKYGFVVAPGADPGRIVLRWEGADAVTVDETGALRLATPLGALVDDAPLAWQEGPGGREAVAAGWSVTPADTAEAPTVRFRLGAYDPTAALVIDPAVLVYCGYIGGERTDQVFGLAVDSVGHLFITGVTGSSEASFPVAVGPCLTYAWDGDAFVAKLDPSGQTLLYCGYLGGREYDNGRSIAVDGAGNAYITGVAGTGYPLKGGPLSSVARGAGVTKINPSGTDLVFSGVIGAAVGRAIAVDPSGCAYVGGDALGTDRGFPAVVGPDLTFNADPQYPSLPDGFVAKVTAAGERLVYCGYLGGQWEDNVRGITVDAAGNAYVCGTTQSDEKSFPVTVGPDLTFGGGSIFPMDAFVARVNAQGTHLDYCGYIGGSCEDSAYGIAVDGMGRAHVAGITWSDETSFPVRVGPDLTYNGQLPADAFVCRVAASGKELEYCGYLGGVGSDWAYAVALDRAGALHVVGDTGSDEQTFPVRVGPDLTFNGLGDAFVAKVRPDGTGLVYCGYLGGEERETAFAAAVDRSGNLYVGGVTSSSEKTFPVRVGPDLTINDAPYSKAGDGFVAKVALVLLEAAGAPVPGGRIDFTVTATDDVGLPYQLASSFSTGPIAIDTRRIELGYDGLLWISVSDLVPGVFTNYRGTIPQDGTSPATLHLPALPATVGLKIHSAFVTLDPAAPSGVRSISNTESLQITK